MDGMLPWVWTPMASLQKRIDPGPSPSRVRRELLHSVGDRRCASILRGFCLFALIWRPALALARGRRGQGTGPRRESRTLSAQLPAGRRSEAIAGRRGPTQVACRRSPRAIGANPAGDQAMGNTALPLLALLKAGVPADSEDPYVRRAHEGTRAHEACSASTAVAALPHGHPRATTSPSSTRRTPTSARPAASAPSPRRCARKLSKEHAKAVEDGPRLPAARAERIRALWSYDVPAAESGGQAATSPTCSTPCSACVRPWTAASR